MNETMALRPQMRAPVEVAKRLGRVNLAGSMVMQLWPCPAASEKDLEVRFDRFARVGPVGRVRDFVRELRRPLA